MEDGAALTEFDGIADEADGIIFSRGNIGLDVAPEKMARVQKCVPTPCRPLVLPAPGLERRPLLNKLGELVTRAQESKTGSRCFCPHRCSSLTCAFCCASSQPMHSCATVY